MSVFITVGSTRFDALISQLDGMVDELQRQKYSQLIVQHGSSPFRPPIGINCQAFTYVDNLLPFINEASLIITHAGAGTLLEILRDRTGPLKLKLIVVVNEALMDNHQAELAMALAEMQVCRVCTPAGLLAALKEDSGVLGGLGQLPPPCRDALLADLIAQCYQP